MSVVAGAAPEPARSAAGRAVLRLVPLYCGERSTLLAPLGERLERLLPLTVERHPPGFDPELAYDPSRGQYNSRILLAQLLRDERADRVLGVAGVDLFIPVLTFVFGEAQLDGRAAVVSTQRLDNALYGLPADPDLLFERLVKEAVHELGHTFALLHCADGRCVMASSTYVEQIDLKGERFCDRCLDALRAHPVAARGRG
jgi:archaemetzincin